MSEGNRVSFHTLGCKLNFSETSTIARQFAEGGFVRVGAGSVADICVINSCSVTDQADKKCRTLIRKLHRENPGAIIAVTGCYAQLKPSQVAAIEGVDIVVGNNDKEQLYNLVKNIRNKGSVSVYACQAEELTNFFAAFSTADRTRAFLKVQDGCNYKCTYCTIPYARGESRNMPIADIVAEARQIADAGQKEIVITGINTGDFGRTTGEKFIDLLRALDQVQEIERYRISSIEPNLLSDEVIALTLESKKFQPHFHIPIQSGCDRILALMRRRYNTAMFTARIEALRSAIPDVFIGIDVIVGFPGETQEDFQHTYDFLKNLSPAYLHIFPYSEREGTPAVDMPDKVPHATITQRARKLAELCTELHTAFYSAHVGRTAKVLYESSVRGGKMFGFTENYIKVETEYNKPYVNRVCNVKLGTICDSGNISATIIE